MLEYCSCASVIEDISHFVHRIYIYMILAKAADEPCSLNRFIKGGPVLIHCISIYKHSFTKQEQQALGAISICESTVIVSV